MLRWLQDDGIPKGGQIPPPPQSWRPYLENAFLKSGGPFCKKTKGTKPHQTVKNSKLLPENTNVQPKRAWPSDSSDHSFAPTVFRQGENSTRFCIANGVLVNAMPYMQ